jgi:hypothetical protein
MATSTSPKASKTISLVVPAFVVGASLIISAVVASLTFYNIRALDNTVSVTGSAKKAVISDQVKWTIGISGQATQAKIAEGYSALADSLAIVKKFLADNGLKENQLNISSVTMNEVWKNYDVKYEDKEYTLYQSIEINSSDVVKITKLSKQIDSLISQGVMISNNHTSYSYTKLADTRVELLKDAVSDARARAEQIVVDGGKKIGKLKSASSGVVQVLAAGSADISDYGSYDTSTVDKEIMVTVKASFLLR